MRRSIHEHRRDVIALLAMVLLAGVTVGYILSNQLSFHAPSWLPLAGKDFYTFEAEFQSGQAVVPGQGQTVNVAGVRVGDVKDIKLEGGRAVVEVRVENKYAPVYRNATILLRPRTPLKDMYLALDPGTKSAGALPEGGRLPVSQTLPDVNYDEVLSTLDSDTRAYLRILLNSAGQALGSEDTDAGTTTEAESEGTPDATQVANLRGTYKRVEPLSRDARRLTTELAKRRRNLRRVVTNLGLVAEALGDVDTDLSSLVDSTSSTFGATAAQSTNLSAALSELPSTLQATDTALGKVDRFEGALGPTLQALRPTARALAPGLRATRPWFEAGTPVVRDEIRPFVPEAQPVVDTLRPAGRDLSQAVPDLQRTLGVVNSLFNTLAYNPPGAEEGFEFWAFWLAHIGPSLLSIQDAMGATPRGVVLATCPQLDALRQVELGNPSLGPIIKLLNTADRTKVCPASANPFG